ARARVRFAVLLGALSTVAAAVLTADQYLLAALLTVGTPVVAWFVAGTFPALKRARRGRAVSAPRAAAPEAEVVAFRSRAEATEPWAGAAPVPVRQAG
ncbi:hypothetical protein J7E95_33730, partial [Streptomyces sp. ISL-14]|nr:hypothetical protein [Streptomyces sp. ISL-14]